MSRVSAQLLCCAHDEKELARLSWNSLSALFLFAALLDVDINVAVEADTPAELFSSDSSVRVINSSVCRPFQIASYIGLRECLAAQQLMPKGYELLNCEAFNIAAHALWSYRWITRPSSQLAIIWSGIEQ